MSKCAPFLERRGEVRQRLVHSAPRARERPLARGVHAHPALHEVGQRAEQRVDVLVPVLVLVPKLLKPLACAHV